MGRMTGLAHPLEFPRFRRVPACAVIAALTAAMTVGFTTPAMAHGADEAEERQHKREQQAGTSPPVVASSNMNLVGTVPETQAISGVFAKSAPYFYISSLDSISVVNVSDPLNPRITGVLPELNFENEAMTYGERKIDGKIHRFVLIGVSTHEYAPTQDPAHVYTGNGEVVVVDVTDPTNPYVRSRVTNVPTSTHTATCIKTSACRYAYTAGTSGRFSIIDLTDLDNPKVIHETLEASPRSPAAGPNPEFSSGAGHKWNFDSAGYGLHTGSGGTAIFDVSDPLHPRLLNTTNAKGTQSPWNDFIHHNSARPNAGEFRPGVPAGVENGNVLLITEEDYLDTDCRTAGSFQTWYVDRLDGQSSIKPLDRINPVSVGEGGSLPQMAFCSAHWFDYHPSGIVVQGFYQGGVRLLDVRNPRDIKEYGYFNTGTSEVWDTYWVPERTKSGRVKEGRKTNIVYAVNFERGVDIFTVDLPKGAKKANGPEAGATPILSGMSSAGGVAGVAGGAILLLALAVAALNRRRQAAQTR